jgi:putative glutamine amidotransferase
MRVTSRLPAAPVAPTTTAVTTPVASVRSRPVVPVPTVGGALGVGGRSVGGAEVAAIRVAGRDVDVLLPGGTSLARYLQALTTSGVFETTKPWSSLSATTDVHDNDHRPTIGIVLSEPHMLIPGAHANTEKLLALVSSLGCRAVLIPPCADFTVANPDARHRFMASVAGRLDGLLGPGGADVDPSIYGEPNTHALNTNPLRDRFEADFSRVALDADLFAFGICRSHQLWNAAAGGSLIQDVEAEAVASVSHRTGHHPVEVKRQSMIFEAVRQRALQVNSLHHQAVDLTGWGFRAVAHVRDDHNGTMMIEATERWNGITTQFHPELIDNDSHRALLDTLGRRAHLFAMIKSMASPSLRDVLAAVRADPRFDSTDVRWVQQSLSRRLAP